MLVPMYMEEFVGPNAPLLQIAPEEFSNVIALTQMTPGPVSVNAATFFGYRMGGVAGALLATVCLLLPSLFLCLNGRQIALPSLRPSNPYGQYRKRAVYQTCSGHRRGGCILCHRLSF